MRSPSCCIIFMNLFKTKSIDVVKACQSFTGSEVPSCVLKRKRDKFILRFNCVEYTFLQLNVMSVWNTLFSLVKLVQFFCCFLLLTISTRCLVNKVVHKLRFSTLVGSPHPYLQVLGLYIKINLKNFHRSLAIVAIVISPFSIENGISDICCFRGVILSPYNCS